MQWALFSDGGLIALGANVLHMAVIGSIGGYAVMSSVRKLLGGGFRGTVSGAVVAAWLSVLAAAALFCMELRFSWASTDFEFGSMFALMVTLHAMIGIGEALITGCVVSVVLQQRPDLIYGSGTAGRFHAGSHEIGRFVGAGLVVALAAGAFVSPFASTMPDGLEAVAEKFSLPAAEDPVAGFFTDYDRLPVPVSKWESVSVSIAGVGGAVVVFAIAMLLGFLPTRRRATLAETAGVAVVHEESRAEL